MKNRIILTCLDYLHLSLKKNLKLKKKKILYLVPSDFLIVVTRLRRVPDDQIL